MPRAIEECVILYVEDDDATAYLFHTAIREAGLHPQIFRVTDGDEAVAFVARTGAYASAPVPDLVLLDLNLPGRNGLEVLAHLRASSYLDDIPVYVFSTSANPADQAAALKSGAAGYLIKGDSFEAFVDAARKICSSLG
jgi:CheY-like chemotaxis protein